MKQLKEYISEALVTHRITRPINKYTVQPKTKDELKEIIYNTIDKEGNDCDLNFIDTSFIKDMSYLFKESKFNGDISEWDVSNVINMAGMFTNSDFNGDISKWTVNKLMFYNNMFKNSPLSSKYVSKPDKNGHFVEK